MVTQIFSEADDGYCTLILAHGAGAAMDSPFMNALSALLLEQGISVLRFEFPYMAQRRVDAVRRPPNQMAVLQDAWRAVFQQMQVQAGGPIVLAGKSMGGRVASMLADELRPSALICYGYPFYPARQPEKPRTEHLRTLRTPTLIVQGERDALGKREVVETYSLSPAIEIEWLAHADHDLKPLLRSGFTHEHAMQHAAQRTAEFIKKHLLLVVKA